MFSWDLGAADARRLAGTNAEGVNAVAEARLRATTQETNFMVKIDGLGDNEFEWLATVSTNEGGDDDGVVDDADGSEVT
jgi:hypothetical protein